MRTRDGRPLVALGNFRSLTEAGLAQTKLASEGIACEVPERHSRYRALGGGGVSVYVLREDYERAASLLDLGESWVEMDEYIDADDLRVARCPSCGSASVLCMALPLRQWALCVILMGIPLLFVRRRWNCRKCGHDWTRGIFG